jgi:uncharacterized protein (TIGR03086 family)
MSENLRNFTKALYAFDHVARLATEKAWDRKTPCDGWTARDVAGHVIGAVRVTDAYARGKTPNMKLLGDLRKTAGADPYATFAKVRDSTLEALDHSGVLAKRETTWFGEQSIDDFIRMMTADIVVHTWDLARSAKVDERLDAGLCKLGLAVYKPFPAAAIRQPGMFAAEIKSEKDADPQTKLLNFAGRRP